VFGHNYTYDAMSRLATVGNGSVTASYTRVLGSNALASTVINNGSTNVMTTARTYDNKSRLTAINSTAGATSRGYNYQYDDKDQRIKCTLADGSYWDYSYDAKGQVTGGVKKDASGKAIPGQSFGYSYDDIGNRTSEQRGLAEMLFSYTANNLNQYTQRTVPGIIPIAGSAATDATVKVRLPASNSVFDTTRDGVYYQAAVPVANAASGTETNLEIHAVKFDTAQDKDIVKTITGKYFVDKTPQTFTYDLDGNTLADGKWNFSWDGENRLQSILSNDGTVKLEYAYDFQSRRVSKKVYTKAATDIEWTLAKHEKFVYDGWNCIAMFNADNAMQKSMLWGEDLSGSMQGAGGVGGLLAETSSAGTYLPGYDGNGNIMLYINAADQSLVAEYVYDAFGRTIFKTGTQANDFVYLFSTKPLDAETGLYYYGYRYYSADMGRWVNRDPIGEKGGENVYGMVRNSPMGYIDVNGKISLATKIMARLAGRTIKLMLPFGIGVIHNWMSYSEPIVLHDDEKELRDAIPGLMFELRKSILSQDLTRKWGKYNLSKINVAALYGEKKVINVYSPHLASTGWWLGSCSFVFIYGPYDAKCENGFAYYKKAKIVYEWKDNIDANSFIEAMDKGAFDEYFSASTYANTIEGAWDIIAEKIMGTDYKIEIRGEFDEMDGKFPFNK